MSKQYIVAIPLAVIMMISSCKKDVEPSRTELLTSGKWRTSSNEMTVRVAGITNTTDVLGAQPSCQQDDLLIFRSDNHLITDEGATSCVSGNPQQQDNGTWIMAEGDTRLLMISSGITLTYKINSLNPGDMQLQLDTSYNGLSFTNVISYIRQD